jgi:hypothetical protein
VFSKLPAVRSDGLVVWALLYDMFRYIAIDRHEWVNEQSWSPRAAD